MAHQAFLDNIRAKTKGKLAAYGLSKIDYNKICAWFEDNKSSLESEGVSKHMKGNVTRLPRIVIYIADGPHKGLHDRSKVTVGAGSFNKATRAIHLDTGKGKVARSALSSDVPKSEISRNDEYVKIDPAGEFFATGAPVKHKGSWKDRRQISSMVDRERSQVIFRVISEEF